MELPPPDILLEQGPVLVVLKPSGVLSQAPPGIDSLELRIKQFLMQREGRPKAPYLAIPHRLDRPVSGVMVFARHSRAAKKIGRQFEERSIEKIYWACVEGHVEPAQGRWEDFVRKVPDEPRAEIVPPEHPEARQAVLEYRTLGRSRSGSWLEIVLQTGRMHQIRVQAASRGWPVVGDVQYGAQTTFGPPVDDARLRPIALHGQRLALRHPMTGEPIDITAAPPATWDELQLQRD
ncbi:MAG: RNA pseudouridine synthase [Pirellulales bacterium]|nr:RNA pseudouridine synthase [Pirellulales bacterium]